MTRSFLEWFESYSRNMVLCFAGLHLVAVAVRREDEE